MSIWCSGEEVGYDGPVDGVWASTGRGEVRSYANGFSNHYPDSTVEQPAAVSVAHMPAWCVPGHLDETEGDWGDGFPIGPWMRLDMTTHDGRYNDPGRPVTPQ